LQIPSNVFFPETRDEFEKWIDRYPLGLEINRKSANDAKIQYGKCGHFKHGDLGASLTNNFKACSRNRRALEDWWVAEDGAKPARCGSCKT
jgi:hypothetical protein